jgi:hypothetical protein
VAALITLRDLIGRTDWLEFDCRFCDRYGRYRLATLIQRFGADATGVHEMLSADCPRRIAQEASPGTTMYERCGARCPTYSRVL